MELSARKSLNRGISILLHFTVAGVAIASVISMQRTRLEKPFLWVESAQQAEQQEMMRLNLLSKTPSFGFGNMVANWTFLNFLQYYGDEDARQQTGYSLSPKYFDLVTQRDPRFVDSYLFLSGTLSYHLAQPDLSLQYMKRGMDALSPQMTPKAFAVWRFAALDQLLLLGDFSAAAYSLEMASQWAGQTQEYQELAPIFQGSADFLKTNPDARLVRFQAWLMVYQQASAVNDRKTQARSKREILALGGVEKVDDKGQIFFTLPKTKQQAKP